MKFFASVWYRSAGRASIVSVFLQKETDGRKDIFLAKKGGTVGDMYKRQAGVDLFSIFQYPSGDKGILGRGA